MRTRDQVGVLRRKLADLRGAGAMRLEDVRVEVWYAADGEEHVEVTLVVAEPPNGDEWQLDDAFELRRQVRTLAADLGLSSEVGVTITSSGEAGTDDSDSPGCSPQSGLRSRVRDQA